MWARVTGVVYRFTASGAHESLSETGAASVREPVTDHALARWLSSICAPATAQAEAIFAEPCASIHRVFSADALDVPEVAIPPRRFEDLVLADVAHLAPNNACECPAHVAELLMQLSAFETYSAECKSLNPADAELHTYLHRVAGAARVLFEAALDRVARAEGLTLR